MCLGFEGMLIDTHGEGVSRWGTLRIADRDFEIGLSFVPEARVGDTLIAHSGQAVRVVSSLQSPVSRNSLAGDR